MSAQSLFVVDWKVLKHDVIQINSVAFILIQKKAIYARSGQCYSVEVAYTVKVLTFHKKVIIGMWTVAHEYLISLLLITT